VSAMLLSVLLRYPDDELLGGLDELEDAAALLPRRRRVPLERLLAWLHETPAEEARAEYVRSFDFDRRAALHVTYHLHGDTRRRGLELVRLKRRYAEAGLPMADGELPDYLPVVLEFTAQRPVEGRAVLAELRIGIELVREALRRGGSPWADALEALCADLPRPSARQLDEARRLAEEGPPAELVGLDAFAAELAEVAE
jgi:nitrate reductase molybdenum cofactor assembly chaperone NarJ/NarW